MGEWFGKVNFMAMAFYLLSKVIIFGSASKNNK